MFVILVYFYDNNNIFFLIENWFFGMVLILCFDNIMYLVMVLLLRIGFI